jgi:hypothetical protein
VRGRCAVSAAGLGCRHSDGCLGVVIGVGHLVCQRGRLTRILACVITAPGADGAA